MPGIGTQQLGVGLAIAGSLTPFDPSQLTGLEGWYRSDKGLYTDNGATIPAVNNGDGIKVWADISGNGRNLAYGTTPPTLATNNVNGINAVSFSGSGIESDTSLTIPQCKFIWVVVNPNQNTHMDICAADSTSGEAFILGLTGPNYRFQYYNGSGSFATTSVNAVVGTWARLSGLILGAANRQCLVNNANAAYDTSRSDSGLQTQSLVIGAYAPGNNSLNGYVAECIFASTVPTTAQLAALDSYAKTRYGFSN